MKKLRNINSSLGLKLMLTLALLLFSQLAPMTPVFAFNGPSGGGGGGSQQLGGPTATEEPIDTTTGNNYFVESRLHVPCPGIPLELELIYQSVTTQPEGLLGKGWLHSYEWFLSSADNNATLYTGTGNKYVFKKDGGSYLSPEINNWKLDEISGGYRVTLPGGRLYFFDAVGRLKTIQDAWGNVVTCSYDANHCLDAVIHSNGRRINFNNIWNVYTNGNSSLGAWRVNTISVPNGASLSFSYNSAGQISKIIEQVGGVISTSRYQYGNGYLTNKVNGAGCKYTFGYKSDGAKPTGKGTSLDVDGYYKHTVDYVNSNTTDVAYSTRGLNQCYRYSRDANDMLQTIYGPATTIQGVQTLGKNFGYVGQDTVVESQFDTAKNACWTTYRQYDNSHNVTNFSVAYCSATKVQVAGTRYDPVWNLPVSVVNAEENRVEIVYTNGLPLTVKAFYSDTQSYDTRYSYNAKGLLAAITNANGHTTRCTYDSAGNLSAAFAERGPVVSNGYNSLGFVTRTEMLSESGTSSGRITQFDRDVKGRVVKTTYADGLTSSNSYNALDYRMNTVDRAGRRMEYTYAPTKKLTSVTQYLQQNGSNVPVRLAYDYDEQFNILSIKEPRGRYVESYALDIQDRITAVTNIEGQAMTFDYSIGSFVTNVTRFDGSKVSTAYDSAGRKSTVTYLSPGHSTLDTLHYTYYADSQLKTISDGSSSVDNCYDRLNRLTNAVTTIGNRQSSIANAYAPAGNLTNSVVLIGNQQSAIANAWAYDNAERLTKISQSGSGILPLAFSYSYSPVNGHVAFITNVQSGVVTSYAYDLMDRATNISYRTASGTLIRSLGYQYDALGMITNKTEFQVSGFTSQVSYEYDTLNRLIREASGNSRVEYSYDLAGNRTTVKDNGATSTCTLGSGDRLASVTSPSRSLAFGYDTAGNTTSIVTGTNALALTWNKRYQLTSVKGRDGSPQPSVFYTYDVLGRRTSSTCRSPLATNEVHYVYSGNQVVADLDASGNILRTYVWGPGIDNLLSLTVWSGGSGSTPTATYYPLKDHQNSVLALADKNGNVVESYEYDAWGRVQMYSSTGQPINSSTVGNRYLFQGREYDCQTGLYYFRARWYSPETGRWLSKDPIGISGGLNLYVFCGNNPVNFVDPRGHEVVYLHDDEGAGYFGHTAIAVGGDDVGWTYLSYEMRDDGTASDNLIPIGYGSLSELLSENSRYEGYICYPTDPTEDAAALTAAIGFWGTDYDFLSHNCDDMATAAMDAAGIDVDHGITPDGTWANQVATKPE
ncbi:MAG: RHS repeat-associated core domain-containing protein [Kiritimatiellales bacterium]